MRFTFPERYLRQQKLQANWFQHLRSRLSAMLLAPWPEPDPNPSSEMNLVDRGDTSTQPIRTGEAPHQNSGECVHRFFARRPIQQKPFQVRIARLQQFSLKMSQSKDFQQFAE